MSEESPQPVFADGDRFHGYVIERLLGAGGNGAVYLVRHEVLDTHFALKVMFPETVRDDPTYIKRFLREARLSTRIRHPNLVTVHDCGHDSEKDVYYLIMDFVSGNSLRDIIAFEGRLAVDRAIAVVGQVASALSAAQAFNVVHRDIKPENIMIQPNGLVKLVDLGIAKAQNLGDSLLTKTDSIFGTPSYISPEQAECSANVDTRADIFSLGMVFFEMLTGRRAYDGNNAAKIIAEILSDEAVPDVRDVCPDLSAEVAILVRRMTMKEIDRRIPNFASVLVELKKLGYQPNLAADNGVEVVAKSEKGMKTIMEGLKHPSASAIDPLANPDDDVKEFLAKRRQQTPLGRLRKLFGI